MSNDSKIVVTKMEAARRQLHVAIRLWFQEADPIAIHTLVFAAYEIIHTLARREGVKHLIFDSPAIKPEGRKDWALALKKAASFFKHANHEPSDATLNFTPEITEFFILYSIIALARKGELIAFEECAYLSWIVLNRPKALDHIIVDSLRVKDN
jgi:hypothetical protein